MDSTIIPSDGTPIPLNQSSIESKQVGSVPEPNEQLYRKQSLPPPPSVPNTAQQLSRKHSLPPPPSVPTKLPKPPPIPISKESIPAIPATVSPATVSDTSLAANIMTDHNILKSPSILIAGDRAWANTLTRYKSYSVNSLLNGEDSSFDNAKKHTNSASLRFGTPAARLGAIHKDW